MMKTPDNNLSFSQLLGIRLESKSQEHMLKSSEDPINNFAFTPNSAKPSLAPIPRFWVSFLGIFFLSLSNLVISFCEDHSNQFIFYVFISTSLVMCPLLFAAYKFPTKLSLTILYNLLSLHLIFTDACVYSGFAATSPAPITCLQLQSLASVVFSTFLIRSPYLLSTFFHSALGLTLLLASNYSIPKSLLDFLIVCFLSIYLSTSHPAPVTPNLQKSDTNVTPLEEILDLLETTSKILNCTSDNCGFCKSVLNSALESVVEVKHKLQTCKNIYSTQLEKITKNMDAEDKVFIEQNAHESESFESFRGDVQIARRSRSESAAQVSKLGGVLKNIGREWNFNTFFLKECTEGSPLEVSGLFILARYKLDSIFQLKESETFLKELESKYQPNPYHNSCHGADVMSSFMFFLTNSELFSQCTDLELLASVISTLGHDVGHPAKNNRFLIITKNSIAIQYNDVSVLENMHSTIVFQIIMQTDFLSTLTYEQWCVFRKICIEMILATDMSKHFDILETFKTKYSPSADFSRAEVRFDLFKVIIKASDIGHAGKNIDLHKKWCEQVIEEFYTQGDLEKKMGLPVSMYCDRDNTNIGKSQSGFIKNIVLPLFVSLNAVLCSDGVQKMCIKQLEENRGYWERYTDFSRKHTFVEKLDTQHTVIRRRSSLPIKQS